MPFRSQFNTCNCSSLHALVAVSASRTCLASSVSSNPFPPPYLTPVFQLQVFNLFLTLTYAIQSPFFFLLLCCFHPSSSCSQFPLSSTSSSSSSFPFNLSKKTVYHQSITSWYLLPPSSSHSYSYSTHTSTNGYSQTPRDTHSCTGTPEKKRRVYVPKTPNVPLSTWSKKIMRKIMFSLLFFLLIIRWQRMENALSVLSWCKRQLVYM